MSSRDFLTNSLNINRGDNVPWVGNTFDLYGTRNKTRVGNKRKSRKRKTKRKKENIRDSKNGNEYGK